MTYKDEMLIAKYPKRMEKAYADYSRSHHGRNLSDETAVSIAQCLDNVTACMDKQVDKDLNLGDTERTKLDLLKKCTLGLISNTLPQLVSTDWVMLHSMTSKTDSVDYIDFEEESASDANNTALDFTINNPYVTAAKTKSMSLSAKVEGMPTWLNPTISDWGDTGLEEAMAVDKAVGNLIYTIDTGIARVLVDAAQEDDRLVWSKTLPIGVSKVQHYSGFYEAIEEGKAIIYNKTRRFVPTYMMVSADVLRVLHFVEGWEPVPVNSVNGCYECGRLGGMKVYTVPNMEEGKFVLGVNVPEFKCSAAVYAPYLPIIPLQFLDSTDENLPKNSFATLYDLEILNKDLLIAGKIVP